MTFDLDVKVKQNINQFPLHHATYAPAKFEVATSDGLGGDAFSENTLFYLDLGFKVTQNGAQYPIHHVIY